MTNIREKFRPKGGYIALISLLIVAGAALTIGLAVSISGIEQIQLSYGQSQADKAKMVAASCVEDGLERLRKNWNNYSGSLSIDGNLCIINVTVNGNSASLTAEGTVDIYTQRIQALVDNNLDVTSWREN